jgi:3-vinyl bacteriochlorophyllide hydratase
VQITQDFSQVSSQVSSQNKARGAQPLYTPEQRARRDATRWTIVQGVLAPLQFLVFLVSLVLVINYLANGTGLAAATASVVTKTLILYAIMVTGAIWEKRVFGQYLFAPAFYWEDMVSMAVIALHTMYLAAWLFDLASPAGQLTIALAAYATYVINAAQFLLKLQAARRQDDGEGESEAHWQGVTE